MRFVILRHDDPRGGHFDFMLEVGEVLKTWALAQMPEPGVEIACEALADHRLAFLDYEGALSGGRGTVARWDCGTYSVQSQNDVEWVVHLAGKHISGQTILRRITGSATGWILFNLGKMRKVSQS